MIETAAVSWSLSQDSASRTDSISLGNTVVHVGVSDHMEVQVGWAPFTQIRSRDKAFNTVSRDSGSGDVSLTLMRGLAGANGSVAVQVFVTVPTGKSPFGVGDWGAGARVPIQVALTKKIQFSFTPEIDAAVNSNGTGRHIAYGSAAGIGFALNGKLQLGTDISFFRDEDPAGASSCANAGLSLAYQAAKNTQFDICSRTPNTIAGPRSAL